MATEVDPNEAVQLARELATVCPRPQRWHPGAEHVAEVFGDLEAAVLTLELQAGAREHFAARLDGCSTTPAPHWPGALEAARARLATLPIPQGEHPYLDLIRPTLEALELALDAIALTPSAPAEFERVRATIQVVLPPGDSGAVGESA